MAGTKIGGQRAAKSNKERHGDDFYEKIGSKGGKNGHTGGFAAKTPCDCQVVLGPHHKAQCAGRWGGIKSRRNKKEDSISPAK
jgi:hypothetical protein